MSEQRIGPVLLQLRWAVPAEVDDEFNRWYDEEHLDDMCRVPGILGGRRFARVELPYSFPTDLNYLTTYQVESLDVLETPAYKALGQNPSEWTRRVAFGLTIAREVAVEAFRTADSDHHRAGQAIVHAYTDHDPEVLDQYLDWYDGEHMRLLGEVPGVYGARRYKIAQSNNSDTGSVGVYELADAAVATSDAWMAAGAPTDKRRALGSNVRSHVQVYRQIYPVTGARELS
jgi:hypothetical protein